MRHGFRIASFGLVAGFIGFLIGRQPPAEADDPATQPSSLNSPPTAERESDARLMDRAYTDPLIVIDHNAAVTERQYVGFFGDNKPQDVYMRGNLRLARSYFGKQDVFCVHPWSQDVPAYADFSQITLQASGTIVFNVHNLFDPKTKQSGHCKATFKVNDEAVRSMTVDGNVWRTVEVPFDHNHVGVEISAIGWWWEHAFFTYEVELNAAGVQVVAARAPTNAPTTLPAESNLDHLLADIQKVEHDRDTKISALSTLLSEGQESNAQQNSDSTAVTAEVAHAAGERMEIRSAATQEIKSLIARAIPDLQPGLSQVSDPSGVDAISAKRQQLNAGVGADEAKICALWTQYAAGVRPKLDWASTVERVKLLNDVKTHLVATRDALAGIANRRSEIARLTDQDIQQMIDNARQLDQVAAESAAQDAAARAAESGSNRELLQPSSGSSASPSAHHKIICPRCGGLGTIGHSDAGTFNKVIVGDDGPLRTCPVCHGTGYVDE